LNADCQGIVVKQTKTLKNRRMILLITDLYGKISAGTSTSERGKGKSALALRPFTLGRYRLSRRGSYINIVEGEAIHSYYDFASDYDKFVEASLILEWTGKIIPEDLPSPEIF
jgi:DNA repair protein RecO (recombination protein O)